MIKSSGSCFKRRIGRDGENLWSHCPRRLTNWGIWQSDLDAMPGRGLPHPREFVRREGGDADLALAVRGCPVSKNICSSPASAMEISIRAGRSLS